MKETDKAVIQFLGYRVSEISYTCPVTLEFPSDAKIAKHWGEYRKLVFRKSCESTYGIRLAIKIRIIKYLSRLMDSLKSTSTGILHGKPICWQYFFRI